MKNALNGYVVLIPAYQPDEKLVQLMSDLKEQAIRVLIVDDGSATERKDIFDQVQNLGAKVLRHEKNQGKGAALKSGIAYLDSDPSVLGIITADADGQHKVEDILKIIMGMIQYPGYILLGTRSFTGKVPLRSRFGNNITRRVFHFVTGVKISDTQSGLRGLPRKLFSELLVLQGERYDYEMNMLLNIQNWNVDYIETPIQTVYESGNKSSHFHPFRDSWQIYGKIIKFGASSFGATLIDYGFFALFASLGGEAWMSYAAARIISSFANYMINSRIVFKNNSKSSLLSCLDRLALNI
jgi:glycosyltransferase involved in cell wall biosynthesis